MDYSKAICKSLPNELKELFFSTKVNELLIAADICKECPVRKDCLQIGLSSYKNNGVWGGTLINRGKKVSPITIKTESKRDGSIKFVWY